MKKNLESCCRSQRRICAKKEEDIPIVKNKERGSTRVCETPVEEEIYLTIKITTDITNILYTKER